MNPDHAVCIHEAASNNDAHLLALFLNNKGIASSVVEDNSGIGLYSLGTFPGIHNPKVFVHRDDVKIAHEMVARYEKKQPVSQKISDDTFCYHCGVKCEPNDESCSNCRRPLDRIEEPDSSDALGLVDDLQNSTDYSTTQRHRKPLETLLLLLPLLGLPFAGILFIGLIAIIALTNYVMSLFRG